MRQINFLLIFAMCLAITLFSIENVQPTVIKIVPGIDVQAPLSVELLLSLGLGATLAWLFSVWSQLQRWLTATRTQRQVKTELKAKEQQIQNLEQTITDLEKQRQFLPVSEEIPDSETT